MSPATLGEMLETLATENDAIWHSNLVQPITLDRGLSVGSRGGHGQVRYHVIEHIPGKLVRFAFNPRIGLAGEHLFEVVTHDDSSAALRHTIRARLTPRGRLTWPTLIKHIHDNAVEDMLDHVERTVTGSANRPAPAPRWVRTVAPRLRRRHVRRSPLTPGPLTSAAMPGRPDAADCFTTPLLTADAPDPATWIREVFGKPPRSVAALMRLRDRLVRPFGLLTSDASRRESPFPVLASSADEIVMGVDDRHLSFRVGVAVADRRMSVTTAVRINHWTGHLYWAIVRWFHPHVVRHMIRSVPFRTSQGGARVIRLPGPL
ncbi:DUF2867 domain-containing protein [Sinosporangium siamense]|uniref:DUF2867 domain-containing protein n=1 Tax=Sinosporangium siamense TaxID=1367973 RepID=UPI00194FF293|nr:DUF2867 domain-containing protein [Sinosporangium siamense]